MPEEGDIPLQQETTDLQPTTFYEPPQKEMVIGDESVLPSSLWNQLKRLARKPVPDLRGASEDPESWKGTHAGDEIEMAEVTRKHVGVVSSFLLQGQKEGSVLQKDTLPEDMSFMILTGDMGKTGAKLLALEDPEPVVARMYIDLFIDQRHADALGISSVGQLMSKPIETVLPGAQKVATELDPSNAQDYETRYVLNPAEVQELRELGYPPDTFPIGAFFSQAHIQEGEKLLTGNPDLSPEQKKLAIIGLSHHFSQNVLPTRITEIDLSDPSVMKTIAYLEVLDKVHAFINRAKIADPRIALESTKNSILRNLNGNIDKIPQCPPDVIKTYTDVFSFFENSKLLDDMKLKEDVSN